MKRRSAIAVGIAAAVTVLTAGCGGSADEAPKGDRTSAAEYGLPAGVEKLTVGTTIAVPPYEFYDTDGKTILGFESEILNEVGSRLGVEVTMKPADFDTLFTGVDAGRYDLLMNGIFDTKTRQAKYDLVDYVKDQNSLLGKSGSLDKVKTLEDLCGSSMAMQAGTVWEPFFEQQSTKCTEAGLEPITFSTFKDNNGMLLAVKSGRADYQPGQLSLLGYVAKTTEGLEVGGPAYMGDIMLGAVFAKDSPLVAPFRAALDEMMADGTYAKILDKWGLSGIAMTKTELNAGTAE